MKFFLFCFVFWVLTFLYHKTFVLRGLLIAFQSWLCVCLCTLSLFQHLVINACVGVRRNATRQLMLMQQCLVDNSWYQFLRLYRPMVPTCFSLTLILSHSLHRKKQTNSRHLTNVFSWIVFVEHCHKKKCCLDSVFLHNTGISSAWIHICFFISSAFVSPLLSVPENRYVILYSISYWILLANACHSQCVVL